MPAVSELITLREPCHPPMSVGNWAKASRSIGTVGRDGPITKTAEITTVSSAAEISAGVAGIASTRRAWTPRSARSTSSRPKIGPRSREPARHCNQHQQDEDGVPEVQPARR